MRRLDGFVLLLLVGTLVAALGAISWVAVGSAERILLPQLDRTAETVGRSLAGEVAQAIDDGVPFDQLYGVEPVLEDVLQKNSLFAAVALTAPDGAVAHAVSRLNGRLVAARSLPGDLLTVDTPVEVAGRHVGQIVIAIPPSAVEQAVQRIWLDIAVVLLASVLVTLEALTFVQGLPMGAAFRGLAERARAIRSGDLRYQDPIPAEGAFGRVARRIDGTIEALRSRQRELKAAAITRNDARALSAAVELEHTYHLDARPPATLGSLVVVRTPLFLFFLAEESTRPFLPGFIATLDPVIPGLSPELVISLPIVLFMAIVALIQPFMNALTERLGRGRSLRLGAVLGIVGFIGTALAHTLIEVLVFRSFTAFGYAATFVAAQGFIIDRTTDDSRARGLALLVSAIMVAALCGPPIGGILADRIGIRQAFLVSAGLAAAGLLCARLIMPPDRPAAAPLRRLGLGLAGAQRLLTRLPLATLLFGCALPAKLMLSAVSFYLVPLFIAGAGFDRATIGRIQMLYAVAMLLLVPYAARLADRWRARPWFVGIGALVAALAVVHVYLWGPALGTALLMLQLGIGQAISIAPQSSLVGELGRRFAPDLPEGSVYGFFRLIERAGNAIGPAIAAVVFARYGFDAAVLVVAVVVGAGAVALLIVMGALAPFAVSPAQRG
jgi:predicted MFS family arabinose efflux permease